MPSGRCPSTVRRILGEAFNKGSLVAANELVAPDSATGAVGGGMPCDGAGFKQVVVAMRTAFPDLSCTVEDEFRVGSTCAA